ncbi:MAG: DUF167 domain-containing protein [Patescibacteria group bacterium]|nr:DUF167 domain-containing protein [Patescibacteria group bacterium]
MTIKVKVIAGASKVLVTKLEQENYKVKLTAPAEKGQANRQLMKVLAEYFRIAPREIEIIKGFGKANKIVKVGL